MTFWFELNIMAALKTISIVGAAGNVGSVVLKHLQAAGIFDITILRRPESTSVYPTGGKVVEVNYTDVEALTSALKGQDGLVVCMSHTQMMVQRYLIDAAAAAGVKRYIPSDFGSNLTNPKTCGLVMFADQIKVAEYLKATVEKSSLTYTSVYNNAFLDWSIKHNFLLDLSENKPKIFDGGDLLFSATTLDSVGDAVVGVFKHPDETKNRIVYVDDIKITQNKLLELAKRAAPGRSFTPEHVKLNDVIARANERLAQGLYDMESFAPLFDLATLGPEYGGIFRETDNELLGVKGVTEDDIVDMFKQHLK